MPSDSEQTPEFLTVKQAALYLNVSPATLYSMCLTGKITHHRFGQGRGAIHIRKADLEDFIRKCRVEGSSAQPAIEPTSRSQHSVKHIVLRHLELRPSHPCGAMTKAGTHCPLPTKDKHCHLHRKKATADG
jgi:excisionase family DNA binding protein